MGRSRVAGVPTTVAASGPSEHQLALPFDAATGAGVARTSGRREVLPAVVHVPGWLTPTAQRVLVAQFRQWARPPAGLRHPRVPNGQLMSVQSVCLGWHWQPYAYSRTADDTDHSQVKPLPEEIADLGRAAVIEAYGAGTDVFAPDAAIVNLYAPGARLGLHQDGEEPSGAPVVTISLGDTCVFRLAAVDRRTGPFTDVILCSGDLLVFGRQNRRIYHGVPKVLSGTAPDGLDLPPGRLSLTLRETGLGNPTT
jgi:alkylated DNA repair protein (DNA oxidative demethylase)